MFFNTIEKFTPKTEKFNADYAKLCQYKQDSHSITRFELLNSEYINSYLYLPKGILLGSAFPLAEQTHYVFAWDVKTGKILSAIDDSMHYVSQLVHLAESIVAIAYYSGKIVFKDYTDPTNPKQLASIELPENYTISEERIAKLFSNCLIVAPSFKTADSLNCCDLFKITFDLNNLSNINPTLTPIAILPHSIKNFWNPVGGFIHAFDETKVIISSRSGLFLYCTNK